MNNKDYIRLSLELHLFFDRIMKEHSIFLDAAFTEKNHEYKEIAKKFHHVFANILNKIISLSDGNISDSFLSSNEIVTENTLKAENKTSSLLGITIDETSTLKELNLKSGEIILNNQLLEEISSINQRTLLVIEDFIDFKEDLLKKVLQCELFILNYPLFIKHLSEEAKMYHDLLMKVEKKETVQSHFVYEQELFWNNIEKEHAQFIRGLLDPSENTLINQSNQFAIQYHQLIYQERNLSKLTKDSIDVTKQMIAFYISSEENILNCKIKSMILPLLIDHTLRESNHFLRILRNVDSFTSKS